MLTPALLAVVVLSASLPEPMGLYSELPKPPKTAEEAFRRCGKGDDTVTKLFQDKVQAQSQKVMESPAGTGGPPMKPRDGWLMGKVQEVMLGTETPSLTQIDSELGDKLLQKTSELGDQRAKQEAACPEVTTGETTHKQTACMEAALNTWRSSMRKQADQTLATVGGLYIDVTAKSKNDNAARDSLSKDILNGDTGSILKGQALSLQIAIYQNLQVISGKASNACLRAAEIYSQTQK